MPILPPAAAAPAGPATPAGVAAPIAPGADGGFLGLVAALLAAAPRPAEEDGPAAEVPAAARVLAGPNPPVAELDAAFAAEPANAASRTLQASGTLTAPPAFVPIAAGAASAPAAPVSPPAGFAASPVDARAVGLGPGPVAAAAFALPAEPSAPGGSNTVPVSRGVPPAAADRIDNRIDIAERGRNPLIGPPRTTAAPAGFAPAFPAPAVSDGRLGGPGHAATPPIRRTRTSAAGPAPAPPAALAAAVPVPTVVPPVAAPPAAPTAPAAPRRAVPGGEIVRPADFVAATLTEAAPADEPAATARVTPSAAAGRRGEIVADAVGRAVEQRRPVRVRLDPPELGTVRVEVTASPTDPGAVRVRLSAAEPAGRAALAEGLPQLREALAVAGVRVETVELEPPSRPDAGREPNREQGRGGGREDGDRSGDRDARGDERGRGRGRDRRGRRPAPDGSGEGDPDGGADAADRPAPRPADPFRPAAPRMPRPAAAPTDRTP